MKVNFTFLAVLLWCCSGLLMPNQLIASDLSDADITCGDTGDLNVNGEVITINNLKITNQGGETAGTFRVGYYLSTNTIISTNDHFIGSDVITSLAPNSTSTEYFSIDLSTVEVPVGTYYVGILLDDQDVIDESDEENNSCFYSYPQVTVTNSNAQPNLICDSPGTLSINGSVITITNARVKNTGDTQAGLSYIGFYLSLDQNFTTQDILIGSQLVSALDPWASSSESITVDVGNMAHIPDGTYFIGSIIDFDERVAETDESDNNECFFTNPKITVGGGTLTGPDLKCIENGYLAVADDFFSITNLQIKNIGDTDAPASTVGYYLSTDEIFTTDDILVGTDYVIPLSPGAISTESITFYFNSMTIAPGTYFVGAIVDHTNAVNESHEIEEDIQNDDQANVCYFTSPQITIGGHNNQPDLQCANRGYLSYTGTTISVSNVQVKNAGNADARDSYIGYYLSLDTEFGSGDIILGTDYVTALTVGASSTESFSVDISTLNIPAGTYYFGSVMDYNNQVDESDEDNNNDCFFTTPTITIHPQQSELPDLSCEFRGYLTVNGTTITVSNSIIKNIGHGTAGTSTLGYYLSPNTSFTTSDILIGTVQVEGLSSWAQSTKTFSVDLSTLDIPSGTYYVGLIIDKEDVVNETNEDNNNDCFFTTPTITINNAPAKPDLTCQQYASLSVSGTTVTVSNLSIKNIGSGSSTATKIGYYLSTNTSFTDTDFLIGTDDIPALQPGGSSTESISVDVSGQNIPAGTYYVGIIIDYQHNVNESNEGNNVCYFTNQRVTITNTPQLPDLICDYEGTLYVNGTQVSINNVRIKNVGHGTAGVSYVGYYLSLDQYFTTDDYLIGSDYINALGSWASSTESFSIDVSTLGIPAGTYYVGTIIDYQNNVEETDENNNICFFNNPRVTIGGQDLKPDLTCLNRGYLNVNGTQISISNFQIKNASDANAPNNSYVGYYLSTDTNFSTSDYLIGTDYVSALAGHAITTESFSVDVSNSGVPPGTYYIGMIIDYQNQVHESSESNNTCFFYTPQVTITSNAKPDLTCESPGYLSVNGTAITLTNVKVKNIGNQTAASTKIGYYLSLDQNFTTGDYFLGSDLISSLSPGQNDTESFSTNLNNTSIPAGTYYVGIIIDYENNVAESNEGNNTCFHTSPRVTISSHADLPDLTCDYRGDLSSSGSYLTIANVRIKNVGNSNANASYIGYYLSTDQNITTSDYFLGEDFVSGLAPWGSSVESITANISNLNIPAGSYFVGIIIDYKYDVEEKDETNNICFFESPKVNIGGNQKPNLICDYRGTLTVTGTNVNLANLRIKNIGNGNAGASVVGYYLSTDQNITTSDYRIGTDNVSALSPWASSVEHFSKDVSNSGVPPGTYYFGIIIDYNHQVTETDEYDNTCFFETPRVTIGGGHGDLADLTCDSPGTIYIQGSSLSINNLVVKNIGYGVAGASRVGYYLSTDPTITTSDYRIGDDYVGSLNPWASSTESFQIDVNTTGIPSGTYYIGAIVDYTDSVEESNEYNNNICDYNRTIQVTNGGGGGNSDRCNSAVSLTCNQTITGSTGGTNTNDFTRYDYTNCHSSSSTFNATDMLYKIDVQANSTLKLRLFDLWKDLDLFVFNECDANPVCVASSTNGNLSEEEVIINNASGTYFIVIDGYNPSQVGTFKLTTTCTGPGSGPSGSTCACTSPSVDEFCDDFESYTVGPIGPQSNCWTTFSVATEDIEQDGEVISLSRDQQLRISGQQRPILLLGNRTSDIYTLDMKVTVPTGNYVQINYIKQFNTGGYNIGARLLFIGDGRGLFNVGGKFYDFNYPNNREFNLRLAFTLSGNASLGRFYIDGAQQYTWQLKQSPGGEDGINKLAGIEFRTENGTEEFFIDDIQFNRIASINALSTDDTPVVGDLELPIEMANSSAETILLNAYPNPTRGIFTTQVELPTASNYRLDVIDINGKILRSFSANDTKQQQYDLDLSEAPNGVYYLRLKTDTEVITKQMVLMK